jgi:hypothetical protein
LRRASERGEFRHPWLDDPARQFTFGHADGSSGHVGQRNTHTADHPCVRQTQRRDGERERPKHDGKVRQLLLQLSNCVAPNHERRTVGVRGQRNREMVGDAEPALGQLLEQVACIRRQGCAAVLQSSRVGRVCDSWVHQLQPQAAQQRVIRRERCTAWPSCSLHRGVDGLLHQFLCRADFLPHVENGERAKSDGRDQRHRRRRLQRAAKQDGGQIGRLQGQRRLLADLQAGAWAMGHRRDQAPAGGPPRFISPRCGS